LIASKRRPSSKGKVELEHALVDLKDFQSINMTCRSPKHLRMQWIRHIISSTRIFTLKLTIKTIAFALCHHHVDNIDAARQCNPWRELSQSQVSMFQSLLLSLFRSGETVLADGFGCCLCRHFHTDRLNVDSSREDHTNPEIWRCSSCSSGRTEHPMRY
jgi:hypothetical protein